MGRVQAGYPWCIGIDPGYGMTGMVLVDSFGDVVSEWAGARAPGEHEASRAALHAGVIGVQMANMVCMMPLCTLRVGIETPVYSGNALTFSKQWRLIQAIEQMLLGFPKVHIELAEIVNSTSKKVLTGNGGADKDAMVAASPYAGRTDLATSVREALADAYAHALAGQQTRDYNNFWRDF